MKAQGTTLLTPVSFAAWSSLFCWSKSLGPIALMRMSTPVRADTSALLSSRSMDRIGMPCSWSFWTAGFLAEAGRTKSSTS